MIRAPVGDLTYWDGRVSRFRKALEDDLATLRQESKNPTYSPQFWFDHGKFSLRVMLLRYSRGDAVRDIGQCFEGLFDAWELSDRLADEVCAKHSLKTCRDWTFELSNLNHYNWCFWLVGLGLALDIPDEQWQRLLDLIGGEGEDELLDRVIASRQHERRIGAGLLHPQPYARLLKAIEAPKPDQAALLREFVEHWYPELARKGKDELWWYVYGDPVKHPLEKGSYFGRWCIEAAAAVKAFGLDDSLCLGNPNYPGDLLRPLEPGTHALPDNTSTEGAVSPGLRNWLHRLFGSGRK